MSGHAWAPRPRDVPGYTEAVTAGLTPARPSRPPSLLSGPTAHQALVRCGVALAAGVVVFLLALWLAPDDGDQLRAAGLVTLLVGTVVAVGLVVAAVRRFRRVLLAELAAGYVTTTFHQGTFWFSDYPGPRVGNDVVGWVWDGVWVLDPAGRVVRAPDPDVEPPGFYPSPNEPERLELWTGSRWLGVYRDHKP